MASSEEKTTTQLRELLLDRLDPKTANSFVALLGQSGLTDSVLDLLMELTGTSSKIASEAVWALPEFQRRCGVESVHTWLDLGVTLADSSGATALKYFKESPFFLGVLDSPMLLERVLQKTLELADSNSEYAPNCAFEFMKKAPELLRVVSETDLAEWVQVGMELAEWDYVLGIEFFRQSDAIAEVVSHDRVRDWVGFGMKLVTKNSLGKTDYYGTVEYFRTSPTILREIADPELRVRVITLGSLMADHSPQFAVSMLTEAPNLVRAFPTPEWGNRVLKFGALVAERDAETAREFLRRAPELLRVAGNASDAETMFEAWFRGGMEVLDYSSEGARAFFALESRKALESLEQAMTGVPLRQVARTLKLFAQGLCGTEVNIEPLADHTDSAQVGLMRKDQSGAGATRARVSPDGKTIFLQDYLRQHPTREENLRLYTVLTAHEAGHLEFGTYQVKLTYLQKLAKDVATRYRGLKSVSDISEVLTLADLFALYPQRGVIHDLWVVLEDARVEYLLQREYPGLERDLVKLAQNAVKTRSLTHGMTAREMVIDCLLLLFTAGPDTLTVPSPIQEVMDHIWPLCQSILRPEATAEDAIALADQVYQTMDEMMGSHRSSEHMGWRDEQEVANSEARGGPRASEELTESYHQLTNWAFRGAMEPEMVRGQTEQLDPVGEDINLASFQESAHGGSPKSETREGDGQRDNGMSDASDDSSRLKTWLRVNDEGKGNRHVTQLDAHAFLYDEWDGVIQDYRPRWCRVIERVAPEEHSDFVETTLAHYAPAVRLLRRYFESIRPTALRRIFGQEEGEELDLNALVHRTVDLRVGAEPSDRVYCRREKRDRQVAAAFLIDMSGSTGRHIGTETRSVIDVEKEGLILLTEALESIGDQYAVYGYSGQGRDHVDFVVVKDFDDSVHGRTLTRIGAIRPLQQNRDGAAIRHTVQKLLGRAAKVRLLILLSDGKPLDDGYGDEYSLEDTKMALREARMAGIDPFCITVDQNGSDYLSRMYGEVNFLVLDHIATLPERLPRIYQRLTT